MLTWIREKFGTIVIGLIIGLITFVFVFSGIMSPKSTRGLHEGAVAGEVNGDMITRAEFGRAVDQRIEFFKNLFGGQGNVEEQIKSMRIRQAVFDDLVRRKLLVQEAKRMGTLPSDEEIRDRIREMEAFKQDGRFDVLRYKGILSQNGYTPESFERLIREDAAAEQWSKYFESRVHVSEVEIQQEFDFTQNKRNIKYVLLTSEAGRKGVAVSPEDLQKFFSNETRLNLARNNYEAHKETSHKGKSFDAVKDSIARDILAGERQADVKKANEDLAAKIQPLLTASKAGDSQVNALLKSYGVEVKQTGLITAQNNYLPGLGEAKELIADAFAPNSPITSKAKTYSSLGWVAVAIVSESQKPEPSKLAAERESMFKQITSRKQREVYGSWMKKLTERAKITPNVEVVGADNS
jgi:parvulin-like peptidyl-prolyl isomerase